MTNARTALLALALILAGSSAAQAAPKDDGSGAVRLVLVGPAVVVVLLIVLALVMLIAAFLRKTETLTAFGGRVLSCLEERRVITPVWGVSAAMLCLVASFALFSSKTFALLGIIVLASGLGLTGFGLCIAAVHLGKLWTDALLGHDASVLVTLALGLLLFVLAAGFPLLGWIAVGIGIGGGVGATLECLFGRR